MEFLSFLKEIGFAGADFAYDEDGDSVECETCGQQIVFKGGDYYCPECDEVIDREDFFDMIGADPPDDKCYTCNNKYPCEECPYGFIEEEDD